MVSKLGLFSIVALQILALTTGGFYSANAALVPAASTINCGSHSMIDDGTYHFATCAPSAGQFGTPLEGVSAAGYTPSGSKTGKVVCVRIQGTSCGLTMVGYSDSDRGNTNASNGANPHMSLNLQNLTSNVQPVEIPFEYTIPNGKYASVSPAAQCGIELIIKEF